MYFTYVLENEAGRLYIGQTSTKEGRLFRHNSNMVISTRNKGPWKMIFNKEFATRKEAVDYELYLKSLKSPKYIKSIIIME